MEMIEENKCVLHESIPNVYNSPKAEPLLTEVQTTYEKRHLADKRIIKYLQFSLPKDV